MGALQAWGGSTGAPERLREHKAGFPQIPPQRVEGTTDDVRRRSQHQIGPMRGSGTVHMRCALAQTTVWHEPLRFSESFYVATYFSFGPQHAQCGLCIPGQEILTTWVPTHLLDEMRLQRDKKDNLRSKLNRI